MICKRESEMNEQSKATCVGGLSDATGDPENAVDR